MKDLSAYSLPPVVRGMLVGSIVMASVLTGSVCSHLAAASFPTRTTVKVTIPYERRTMKVQNDFVIVWLSSHLSDNSRDRIELFNRFGEKLFSVNPLKDVRDAKQMSIWDVSVGPTGLVAVAAVYADEEGRHIATLLVYSSSGGLIRSFAPEHMGLHLAIDEDENFWVLGVDSGNENDPPLPLVSKFNRNGQLVGRYVSRANLPPTVSEESGVPAGMDAIGLTNDRVWFWIPERRALGTLRKDGTHIEVFQTGTPDWTPPEGSDNKLEIVFGGRPNLLPSGTFVVPVAFQAGSAGDSALYAWDAAKAAWKKLSSAATPLPKGAIAGTDGDRVIFGFPRTDRPEIEFESVDLP